MADQFPELSDELSAFINEQKVLARITRKSLINLSIKIGQKVYIQFKAVSLGAISMSLS